jgi:hypothetical protein
MHWTPTTATWVPTPDQAVVYLAAIIDGEGCVDYRPGRSVRRILIANTEMSIIDAIMASCAAIGVTAFAYAKKPNPPRKQSWEVNITGQRNLRVIADRVPLQSRLKADRLTVLIDSYQTAADRWTSNRAETRRRDDEALRLRGTGMTWKAIGAVVGLCEAGACRAAGRASKRAT